jgi:adenylate cyclase
MPDLIAQGSLPQNRWRRPLADGERIVVGRECGSWSVSWDRFLSRQHVELIWRDGKLTVKRLTSASNPIYFAGRAEQEFELRPGEHFVIGDTSFMLAGDRAEAAVDSQQPIEERTFASHDLRRIRFRNPDQRLDVLTRLPDVISGSLDDTDLFMRLVNMLLAGISRADTVALVRFEAHGDEPGTIEALHWDRRHMTGDAFHPSQSLVREAVRGGQSVLHVWSGRLNADGPVFTLSDTADWAFCTPIHGAACSGWAVYVAGKFIGERTTGAVSLDPNAPEDSRDLRDDLRFTELVAHTISALRQAQYLQRQQATLSQFFAPAVLHAITNQDAEVVLAPRETEVSVLFCDLRGFSLTSERNADDLLGLLKRVSKALGVMTHHILEQGGVFGDFQGDAAMGFWGWPLAQQDKVERACQAALAIRRQFQAAAPMPDHPLADFQVGIGLATGNAVAGRIGTEDQVKVTVFGPLVNRASRLEGMTKLLHAPILLDATTASIVRAHVPPSVARCRRIAIVRPYGMDQSIEVSELLPPACEYPELTDDNLKTYEQALDAFLAGRWSESLELLYQVPPKDRVKDFLTVYIVEHNRTPPTNWNGIIPLSSKR